MKFIENLYYMNSQKRFLLIMMTSCKGFVININILNRHAPRKRKLERGNQMPFITKDLSKALMKRSRLRSNFHKNRTGENKTLYAKHRHYCVSLLKKSKKKYFANLNEKDTLGNKLC